MSKLTRSGVAYDLTISPHYTEVLYDNGVILKFVFSSSLYRDIFEDKIDDNRMKINESLSNRFKMDMEVDLLADLKLYSTVEKRGFLIKNNEESYLCLNSIKLSGLMMTKRN